MTLVYQDLMGPTVNQELLVLKVWQDQQVSQGRLVLRVLRVLRVNPVLTVHLDRRVSKGIKDLRDHWVLPDCLVLQDS